MKLLVLFSFLVFSCKFQAQFKTGYDETEVRDMIALCNSFTFLELYNSDKEIIPKGYEKIYTSGVFGMDNKYQIYKKGNVAVINLRGSTDKSMSWMENIYSAMIPSKGVVKIQDKDFEYNFADDTTAAVHAGYTLGIAYLSEDIVYNVKRLNKENIHHIIITGHSQGGALSHLLRAHLESLSGNELSDKNQYKTYAFANPMVGNKAFADEYNRKYCYKGSSFSIVNPADPVIRLPITYDNGGIVTADNVQKLLFDREALNYKEMAFNLFFKVMEKDVTRYIQKTGMSLNKQLANSLGSIDMPEYVRDIKYEPMNVRVELNPFDYPKVLRDSSVLKNDSIMRVAEKDVNGNFTDKSFYQKEPNFYQHKPYNYYVSILKKYFPADYKKLKKKYLEENL